MAQLRIIPREEFDQLAKLLGATGGPLKGCVLMPDDLAKELEIVEGEYDYDFGGDPDVMVDLVFNEDHYFIGKLLGR